MENQSVSSKYKRQPKIYLALPSNGKYYPTNPQDKSGSGELPIYSMTAKDELEMKTPDALMNGESTTSVVKSCCPLIDDPWSIPNIDIDALLIAIRIATYGEKMDMEVPITGLKEPTTETYQVDLREVLDSLRGLEWKEECQVGDLTFIVKPITYKQSTDFFQTTYEQQRIAGILANEKIPEKEKLQAFKEGFKKLSQTTLELVVAHVAEIRTPEGSEINKQAIREFFDSTDKATFTAVSDFVEANRKVWQIKPRKFAVSQELQEQGAPETIEVPLLFDQSNFFVSK